MTTIAAFRRNVINERVPAVKKLVAFTGFNAAVLMSPVDTGRYRGAWNLGVGTADLSVPPEGASIPPPTPPPIGNIPPGVPIVLSNNVPYALEIERGHSQQAPNGVAALTVRHMLAAYPGLVSEAKAQGERGGL